MDSSGTYFVKWITLPGIKHKNSSVPYDVIWIKQKKSGLEGVAHGTFTWPHRRRHYNVQKKIHMCACFSARIDILHVLG